MLTFGHKLSFAPLQQLHRVLDVGTGTGIWAINFGQSRPLGNSPYVGWPLTFTHS